MSFPTSTPHSCSDVVTSDFLFKKYRLGLLRFQDLFEQQPLSEENLQRWSTALHAHSRRHFTQTLLSVFGLFFMIVFCTHQLEYIVPQEAPLSAQVTVVMQGAPISISDAYPAISSFSSSGLTDFQFLGVLIGVFFLSLSILASIILFFGFWRASVLQIQGLQPLDALHDTLLRRSLLVDARCSQYALKVQNMGRTFKIFEAQIMHETSTVKRLCFPNPQR